MIALKRRPEWGEKRIEARRARRVWARSRMPDLAVDRRQLIPVPFDLASSSHAGFGLPGRRPVGRFGFRQVPPRRSKPDGSGMTAFVSLRFRTQDRFPLSLKSLHVGKRHNSEGRDPQGCPALPCRRGGSRQWMRLPSAPNSSAPEDGKRAVSVSPIWMLGRVGLAMVTRSDAAERA